MIDQQRHSWHVATLYLSDNKSKLSNEEVNLLSGKLRARDLKGLLTTCEHLLTYVVSRERMRILMQLAAFFKKNADFCTKIDGDKAALLSFHRAERLCRITNRRLDHYYVERGRIDQDLSSYMSRMESCISRLLGDHVSFLDSLPLRLRLTSGASSHLPRSRARPYQKISGPIYVTPMSKPLIEALRSYYGYKAPRIKETMWNRVTFVPKNWKTNRTIAAEPSGILPVQLAVDEYIKERLCKVRIDLAHQSVNQELARRASITGSHATIDLSMASDTLSLNVINWLFPEKWRNFLMSIRSPYGKLPDGSFVKYAKFSSMGNGCTFTLETLVFTAACLAVGSKDYSVYGDDIIIETELAPKLFRLLKFLGFIPNSDKTFTSGPFRESCGVNCYDGIDITPFYLREWSDRNRAIASHNVNGLAKISTPGQQLWNFLLQLTTEMKLPLVPYNFNSLSGVFVDVHTAYALKLIKNVKDRKSRSLTHILKFKALVLQGSEDTDISDSRGLFLWYFTKNRLNRNPLLDHSSSWDKLQLGRRFKQKWVHWYPGKPKVPEARSPDHLHWWSEDIVRGRKAAD